MPIPLKYTALFEENSYYHVFNRTNNKEALFRSDEDRAFFLWKFRQVVGIYADIFCWSLLSNHFHFLVRIKSCEEITTRLSAIPKFRSLSEKRFLKDEITLNTLVQHAFKRFFQSYALAYNKQYYRTGNLFNRPFRRVAVRNSAYYTAIIIYIHTNPSKHGACENFRDYRWSSYKSICDDSLGNLQKNEVLEWFGGREAFEKNHEDYTPLYKNLIL